MPPPAPLSALRSPRSRSLRSPLSAPGATRPSHAPPKLITSIKNLKPAGRVARVAVIRRDRRRVFSVFSFLLLDSPLISPARHACELLGLRDLGR